MNDKINKEKAKKFIGTGIRAYADDILINFFNTNHLKLIIKIIEQWANRNEIAINKNHGKSHIIYINNNRGIHNMKTVNGIAPTINYKYLGIQLERSGRYYQEHLTIQERIKKFNKYYLLNKAHLSTLTTKIFIYSYIQAKFLYHLVIFNELTIT